MRKISRDSDIIHNICPAHIQADHELDKGREASHLQVGIQCLI